MDANTGENVLFKNLKTPVEKLQFAATVSASIHFVSPAQYYKGYMLMDGVTANGVNFVSAVQKCLEYVETEAQITLHIAICDYFSLGTESLVGKTV